jgi:5,10-methylenetetrahydromethanopterin reductase
MDIDLILEPDRSPAEIRELGLLAERYGIRTLWASNYASARDVFLSLVPLAQATQRLGIGVLVVSPWEMHPLKMANSLLTLNEYCDGRAQLVVSGGGEWCGVMGVGHERRVRAVREAIEIIRRAATGKPLNYKGKLYQSYGYNAAWAKQRAPLVYAGASKPQMLRMGAECADGVMMSDVTLHYVTDMVGVVRRRQVELGQANRPLRISNFWAWHVKEDQEASLKEARREMILRGWLARYHLEPFMSQEDCDFIEAHKSAFLKAWTDRSGDIKGVPQRIIDKLIENFSCSGDLATVDRHIETLRGFAAAGLTEIALRLHDDPDAAIHVIGEHVVPALR